MATRCNDCGKRLSAGNQKRKPLMRSDVCDGCWATRIRLVNGEITSDMQVFAEIQKEMASRSGKAAILIAEIEQPNLGANI
mgnify:CR=1 FL=1